MFVVPAFNRAADLPRTLGAIAAQDWPAGAASILLVDNGSTDGTRDAVASLAARLPLRIAYRRKAPEGPAAARNLGLAAAPTDGFVAFVDSDVELDRGWTRATVAAMQADPLLAMVGGRVLFAHRPDVLNAYGGAISRLGLAWDLEEGAPVATAEAPRDVAWANASALLCRPWPLVEAGGFDADFFYAYEEPDLALRLALAGHRCRVVPDATAFHHVGAAVGPSHPDIVFHAVKNRLRMGLKAFGARRLAWWVPAAILHALADASLHAPRGARWRGLAWNLRHLPKTLDARRKAQALRRLPDEEAFRHVAPGWFPPTRLAGLRRRPVEGLARGAAADDRAA
nr:glycosyltransferase [Neoroseomonas nitratireducens]